MFFSVSDLFSYYTTKLVISYSLSKCLLCLFYYVINNIQRLRNIVQRCIYKPLFYYINNTNKCMRTKEKESQKEREKTDKRK